MSLVFPLDDKPSPSELAHFGVKGMRWGHRKSRLEGVSAKTFREAGKDAEEFTRAKMFYGESAGTRRKLIKATVEAKAKKDPAYKKAFDHHVANTDMGKRAEQARGQRRRKNAVNSTRKTGRGIFHVINGNSQYASMAAALIAGGALYAHKQGIDKVILNTAKTSLSTVKQAAQNKKNKKIVEDLFKNAGLM